MKKVKVLLLLLLLVASFSLTAKRRNDPSRKRNIPSDVKKPNPGYPGGEGCYAGSGCEMPM